VTANSNAAVDHLLRSCADMDVVKFRMGHPARVHNDCTPYLLDELVKKELDAPSIKALEKQLKNIRTKLQGGGLPKPLYRDLKKELKDLEQERRSMEHRVEEHLWSEVQMVFVTNTGISSSWFGGRVFDVLVMDEAAQCIEPDAWIPMFYGKRVVMAGDPKQLGAVLHSKSRTLSRSLMQRYMDMGVPVTMLSTQYRMHPEIAQFSSERYYDGDLVSPEVMASQSLCQLLGDGLAEWLPLMFVDMAGVDGGEQRLDDSYMNELEGRFVIQRVLELLKLGLNPESIGVIAPYSAQVKWIRDHLKDRFTDIAKLEVQTVDGFQGREKEVIFFSAVRNSGELGFLRDAERLNVALTRAKSHLCVIGESSTLALDKDWDAFMAHCEAVGAYRSIWEFEV
jgi:superfamily I DNA and/or RNA helicase